jgi:N-acetylmuramoyl-L-alanine amidase
MYKCFQIFLFLFSLVLLPRLTLGQDVSQRSPRLEKKALRKSDFLKGEFKAWAHLGNMTIDSIHADKQAQLLDYFLNPSFTQIPARSFWINNLKSKITSETGRTFKNYTVRLWSKGRPIEEYIPNVFRDSFQLYDKLRMLDAYPGTVLKTNLDQVAFPNGLTGSHIALWPSHGFFYDQQLDRWQWQRARLWQTVEDIFPWSFTSAYLVPMLENAGANVLLPRERDTQTKEVIVDNDFLTGRSQLIITNGKGNWNAKYDKGFMWADTLFPGQNPFVMGTALALEMVPEDTASLNYVPEIPETGEYAVYVSYAGSSTCVSKAYYEVRYSGGKSHFSINQCMGAATWIYLGTYQFEKGLNPALGSVKVTGSDSGILTSDAIRFGGGMGNVARRPDDSTNYHYKISGKPRWMEGSRYYLQYSGMPDSITYSINHGKNDYTDDYMSRPEWVNYTIGSSRPQYNNRYVHGLQIPVDLSLAFHTDAGVTESDSVIGTLGIFSTIRNNGFFPDGRSKLASRDLADIVQTQVVEDIRQMFNPDWTRRGLWDREYSEAWRPVVPTMLLELLSHQNMADMRYGLDPRFRFATARAIYKGITRYYAASQGREAVIQPLPPDHMAIEVISDREIKLTWKPLIDPVEPSAVPSFFKVYQRTEDQGFDQGIICKDTFMIIQLPEWGNIYSYRVTAINSGGESLPGEILSVSLLPQQSHPVLIVNAFDRVCAPAFFDKGDMAGIAWWEDEGIARDKDLGFSGYQYNFNRNSSWIQDDNQGWGASNADMETIPVAGNSFDYPFIHGKALSLAGYAFVSVSDEVFESAGFNASPYDVVDVIFGEERGTSSFQDSARKEFRIFTPGFIRTVTGFVKSGGNVLISGAYIGTDMIENSDSSAIVFASHILHFVSGTNHATTVGLVNPTEQGAKIFPGQLEFNTKPNGSVYRVEAPDGIEPIGKGAYRIGRYVSGNVCAGVAFQGTYRSIALGFPFEVITDEIKRAAFMGRIMQFLLNNR